MALRQRFLERREAGRDRRALHEGDKHGAARRKRRRAYMGDALGRAQQHRPAKLRRARIRRALRGACQKLPAPRGCERRHGTPRGDARDAESLVRRRRNSGGGAQHIVPERRRRRHGVGDVRRAGRRSGARRARRVERASLGEADAAGGGHSRGRARSRGRGRGLPSSARTHGSAWLWI